MRNQGEGPKRVSAPLAKPFRKCNPKKTNFKTCFGLELSVRGAERARQFIPFNDFALLAIHYCIHMGSKTCEM